MSSNLKVNTILPSTGTAIGIGTASGNVDVLGHIVGHNTPNISGINSVTATTFYGDGSNLTGLSGVSVANQSDNRLITATGTTDALNGEANLQFDGTDLYVSDSIKHLGDTDTKIAFANNEVDFQAAGSSRFKVTQYATYVQSGHPLAFLASSGATPNMKSGGTNYQDLLFTTGSGNPTRLRISSEGYVTKPSQPAFHAYGANSWTQYTGSNNILKLLNTECNIGSHYKTSGSDDGKFVCPVAGTYFFYLTIYSGRTDNSQVDNSDYLAINLVSSTGNLANKGGHHIAHYYNEADRDSTRTMSYIKTCAVGEKIYIQLNCNGTGFQVYGGHSGFGGYLIG